MQILQQVNNAFILDFPNNLSNGKFHNRFETIFSHAVTQIGYKVPYFSMHVKRADNAGSIRLFEKLLNIENTHIIHRPTHVIHVFPGVFSPEQGTYGPFMADHLPNMRGG